MMNVGKETETLEFKEGIAQLDKGILGISAMLNRHHYGTVYFGVDDKGDVIGMDVGDSTLEKIRNAIRTDIKPQVIPEIEVLESDDGKLYVSVAAEGHNVPYSCKDRYYIRNVTSNEKAEPDVLVQIAYSRGLDPLRDIASDVQELTFDHLLGMLISRGFHPRDDDSYYASLGLKDSRGRFNMTAYLVSDQNHFPIQIVEFRGKDRSKISRREEFSHQSLVKTAKELADKVSLYMVTNVDTSTVERREEPLFDFDAFREAWINACVHNSWVSRTPPSVLVFDDRIEIVSYGMIPFPLSSEEFFTGSSRPINKDLFGIFSRLDMIEQSGHGVPAIVSAYGREAFSLTENGVTVTIPFRFKPRFVEVREINDRNRMGLDPVKRGVLDYVEANPSAKLSEVASYLGITLSSVKKEVQSLKASGMLRNDGTNRNSRWVVVREWFGTGSELVQSSVEKNV